MPCWYFPPEQTGGVAAHVAGLSAALVDAGHDVVVLTRHDDRAARATREFDAGHPARVIRTPVELPWLPDHEKVARIASADHALLHAALDTAGPLADWRPDVVHGHDWEIGWTADTLAAAHGVPFVLTMHGIERVRHGGHLPPGVPTDVNAVEWWLAFRAHRVISTSTFMVDQLLGAFELPPERVVRIPNGIDPDGWAAPGPPSRRPLVVSWGRVQYEKGFQVLARAVHTLRGRIPDLTCTIAGRGSYLPELQTQIDVEGVSDLIDLPGYLGDVELHELVHRAGCVVIPSLYEPFGIVALEALAAGTPLIVARTGGLAELVAGTDAGLTFEPGNAVELVLLDGDLADRLRTRARALVEQRFAWDAIAATTTELYADVIAEHP